MSRFSCYFVFTYKTCSSIHIYVTRFFFFFYKIGLKSLGQRRAISRKMRNSRWSVSSRALTVLLQLTRTFKSLRHKLDSWFKYRTELHCVHLLTVAISENWSNWLNSFQFRQKDGSPTSRHPCFLPFIFSRGRHWLRIYAKMAAFRGKCPTE